MHPSRAILAINFVVLACVSTSLAQPAVVAPSSRPTAVYSNPLPVAIGDPFVLRTSQGRYYLYGTGGARNGFAAFASSDLVRWTPAGQVYFGNTASSWCVGSFWAPEVYELKGKFYMFYSAQWRNNPTKELENFRIGVAVADQPTGPFVDIRNQPIFDPGYPIIDADVLFDEDGRVYLFYSRCCYKHPVDSEIAQWARKQGWYGEIEESWLYGIEIKPDFSGVIGEPVLLLRPPASMSDAQSEWESRSVTAHEINRRWTEGSLTFRRGDTYYMMYSANHFAGENYAIGYATAQHPLGPYTKAANNPILQKNSNRGGEVSGTGHNSVTLSPDGSEMFCVYHARTSRTGNNRVMFIDRMDFQKDGTLTIHGPSTTPQPVPSLPAPNDRR